MPREFMCPQCARLVSVNDRYCSGCNADLRCLKPVETLDSTPDPLWIRLISPWPVAGLAAGAFLIFGLVARGNASLARVYLYTAIAWTFGAPVLVKLAKLKDGLDEFLWYLLRPGIIKWVTDDPLDYWMLGVVVVAVLAWLMLGGIVAPTLP